LYSVKYFFSQAAIINGIDTIPEISAVGRNEEELTKAGIPYYRVSEILMD
jgi:pyruvate/2-oxoglutarate dehydrogenase complex dihydrolipoamide dehydrogenase (E3) component